jgi:hypothetical protein
MYDSFNEKKDKEQNEEKIIEEVKKRAEIASRPISQTSASTSKVSISNRGNYFFIFISKILYLSQPSQTNFILFKQLSFLKVVQEQFYKMRQIN